MLMMVLAMLPDASHHLLQLLTAISRSLHLLLHLLPQDLHLLLVHDHLLLDGLQTLAQNIGLLE